MIGLKKITQSIDISISNLKMTLKSNRIQYPIKNSLIPHYYFLDIKDDVLSEDTCLLLGLLPFSSSALSIGFSCVVFLLGTMLSTTKLSAQVNCVTS